MKPLLLGIVTAAAMLASVLGASAQQANSTTGAAPIYSGPGTAHVVTGTLPANSSVIVDHCENGFCFVYAGRTGTAACDEF